MQSLYIIKKEKREKSETQFALTNTHTLTQLQLFSGNNVTQLQLRVTNQPIGAESDQHVNIYSFVVRCDQMWPNTQ